MTCTDEDHRPRLRAQAFQGIEQHLLCRDVMAGQVCQASVWAHPLDQRPGFEGWADRRIKNSRGETMSTPRYRPMTSRS
jgi:hypothetical protein